MGLIIKSLLTVSHYYKSCLFVCLYLCLPACTCLCLPASLPACLSVSLSACMALPISLCACESCLYILWRSTACFFGLKECFNNAEWKQVVHVVNNYRGCFPLMTGCVVPYSWWEFGQVTTRHLQLHEEQLSSSVFWCTLSKPLFVTAVQSYSLCIESTFILLLFL